MYKASKGLEKIERRFVCVRWQKYKCTWEETEKNYSGIPLYRGSVFAVLVFRVFSVRPINFDIMYFAALFMSLNIACQDRIAVRTDSANQNVSIVFSATDWLLYSRRILLLALFCFPLLLLSQYFLCLNVFILF